MSSSSSSSPSSSSSSSSPSSLLPQLIPTAALSRPSLTMLGLLDGASGAAAGFSTEFIFYGLDSYKVMMQSQGAGVKPPLSKVFRGILPIVSMGAIPSYGIFFACYKPLKVITDERFGEQSTLSILTSSTIASFPSSILYVPADTVKKRMMLSGCSTLRQAYRDVVKERGLKGLFLGWQANLSRDVPFSVIKICLFEMITVFYCDYLRGRIDRLLSIEEVKGFIPSVHSSHRERIDEGEGSSSSSSNNNNSSSSSIDKKEVERIGGYELTRTEAGAVGFISGTLTAILTNPLDCINTRIKSGELAQYNIQQAARVIVEKDGASALFRGMVPRAVMIGIGSTVFWYIYAAARTAVGLQ